MLVGVSVWVILAPAIAAQYGFAVVGLIALSKRNMKKVPYVIWNLCIVSVFFAGTISFLIYNRVRPVRREKVDENK